MYDPNTIVTVKFKDGRDYGGEINIIIERECHPLLLRNAMLENIQRIKDDMNRFNDDTEEN